MCVVIHVPGTSASSDAHESSSAGLQESANRGVTA